MKDELFEGDAGLPLITQKQILGWSPRKEAVPSLPKGWKGTVLKALACEPPEFEGYKRYDWLLWVVLRNECYPSDEFAWRVFRIFSCDCVERVLKYLNSVPQQRIMRQSLDIALRYAKGGASIAELAAAFNEVKIIYQEARVEMEEAEKEAESLLNIRSPYASLNPVDYSPGDAYAAARCAVKSYTDGDSDDNAAVDAFKNSRVFVRLHVAEAARAACNAVADPKTAALSAVLAARADFHSSVYSAARVEAATAADDAVAAEAEKKAAAVVASDNPLKAADSVDNAALYRISEEAFTGTFIEAYNRIRAGLDAEERRRQASRLKEIIKEELKNANAV